MRSNNWFVCFVVPSGDAYTHFGLTRGEAYRWFSYFTNIGWTAGYGMEVNNG